MSSLLETVLQIVRNTPLWVWPLMVLVIWLGILGLRSRTLPLWRLAVLPAVGLVLSFVGLGQAAQPALALVAWLVALAVALPLGDLLGRRRTVHRLDDGRLEIAGGWFMLVFGISIFAVRYALGVVFGMAPALRADPAWIALAGGVGGFVAGIGLGWLGGVGGRSSRWIRRLHWAPAIFLLTVAAGFGGVIAFSSPGDLPRLLAGDSLPGMSTWNMAELPPVRRVAARDGAPLAYRVYPARPDRAVVLVHGSSGTNISMHKSAQALQAAGATVYSISLRGHGGSGTANGDTSYRNQLDDDLMDFLEAAGLTKPGLQKTLIGFSSGGGFVLRAASGANRQAFDAYLAISPYIAQDAPTTRPASGGWVSVAVPRVIALSILDGFGMPWFQGLPVVRFATGSAPSETRTPVYSFRLASGLQLSRDWRREIARIDRPMIIAVGENDELFRAEQYAPLLKDLNPRISVEVVPGLGHLDMIARERACAAIAALWRRLSGESGT
jgi:alpha-beta hydrolase superfamily lysophospholipase